VSSLTRQGACDGRSSRGVPGSPGCSHGGRRRPAGALAGARWSAQANAPRGALRSPRSSGQVTVAECCAQAHAARNRSAAHAERRCGRPVGRGGRRFALSAQRAPQRARSSGAATILTRVVDACALIRGRPIGATLEASARAVGGWEDLVAEGKVGAQLAMGRAAFEWAFDRMRIGHVLSGDNTGAWERVRRNKSSDQVGASGRDDAVCVRKALYQTRVPCLR